MKHKLKIILLPMLAPLLIAATPLLREDLQHAGKLLCAKQASVDKAWELKIYDTLLAAEFKPRKTANPAKLALEHAKQTTNFGYMHGACADKRTWILSVSAPYALQIQAKTGMIKLNPDLKRYCRELGAMFAPDGLQHPTPMRIAKHVLVLPKNKAVNGVVAINCKSLTPTRIGPRLLYALPVGKPSLSAPLLPSAKANPDLKVVGSWLNRVRKQLKLPAIAVHPYEHGVSDRHSVIHDRVELGRVSKKLQQQQRKFLGENRVRSYSLREALSMLWLSPFHRSLLLHKDAKNIYVRIAKQEQQLLLTMIFSS